MRPRKTSLVCVRFLRTPLARSTCCWSSMVENAFVFTLPNGRSAAVAQVPARLIYERLWELGVAAGAATAAARISDALRSSPSSRADVVFSRREAPALLEASKAHPPTWTRLSDPGALAAVSRDERRHFATTCRELVGDLAGEFEGERPQALIDDLERLRDRLRAMRAGELLCDASDRVACGWSQGTEARAIDGRPVDVLDPDAAYWSLLGALQGAAFANPEAQVDEIRCAVAALAELITEPSLAQWNDHPERTSHEVHAVLSRAEASLGSARPCYGDG